MPPPYIPFEFQRLDVEAEGGGDGADVLVVELLEDGRLPRVVQPEHQEPHLALPPPDLLENGEQAHGGGQQVPRSRWWMIYSEMSPCRAESVLPCLNETYAG